LDRACEYNAGDASPKNDMLPFNIDLAPNSSQSIELFIPEQLKTPKARLNALSGRETGSTFPESALVL